MTEASGKRPHLQTGVAQKEGAAHLRAEEFTAAHGFFGRKGGVSGGVYDSLQCGYGAKEDAPENVDANRERVRAAVADDLSALITAYQIHSPRALAVSEPWRRDEAPEADALATRTPGLAIGVLTADCAPVLLEDSRAGVVGAAHAGWKGAIGGVLDATLDVMEALGARRGSVKAVVGPTIAPESYEVGPEFVSRFLEHNPANAQYFLPPHAPGAIDAGKAQFDLPRYVVDRLRAAGVGAVRWLGADTYAEGDMFFSNRRALHRGESDYGRQISVITAPTG
ncbi:MAG: peptidoglycan editing factor PgeF [Neomegalonema sp.]|nr:peptidoglycan editing factor PgeF [Neomegalonema sp.]